MMTPPMPISSPIDVTVPEATGTPPISETGDITAGLNSISISDNNSTPEDLAGKITDGATAAGVINLPETRSLLDAVSTGERLTPGQINAIKEKICAKATQIEERLQKEEAKFEAYEKFYGTLKTNNEDLKAKLTILKNLKSTLSAGASDPMRYMRLVAAYQGQIITSENNLEETETLSKQARQGIEEVKPSLEKMNAAIQILETLHSQALLRESSESQTESGWLA